MEKIEKPLISYFSQFLDYCHKKNFSSNTLLTYTRSLKKFGDWLTKTKKRNLAPSRLKLDTIKEYQEFLSRDNISSATQNIYLGVLRLFLKYISKNRNNLSFSPERITLPRIKNKNKENSPHLTLKHIEKLLSLPNIKTETGLRDKSILELITHSGIKVSKLVSLNRGSFEKQIKIPSSAMYWIKRYISTRKDKSEALFINYKGKKARTRITPRSVERIIKRYEKIGNFSIPLTPEKLRWGYMSALYDEQNKIEITRPFPHKTIAINSLYDPFLDNNSNKSKIAHPLEEVKFYSWNIIENHIAQETEWLKNKISISHHDKNNKLLYPFDQNVILRKIGILIISGKVRATEIYNNTKDKYLWKIDKKIVSVGYQGKEWHKDAINKVYNYFLNKDYILELEPPLNYGRADLKVNNNLHNPLYIEIGTISSFFKLWYNISTMKHIILLIIPSLDYAIEFRT